MKAALLPFNDPIRAETFSPAGPAEATFPPGVPPAEQGGALYMASTAADKAVTARSGVASVNIPGVVGGTVASASSALLSEAGDVVSSTASVTTSGLEIAGVLRIGSLEATATSASNGGGPAKVDARTIISGVNVLGIPASIDGKGLTLQGANAPLGPVLEPVLQGVEDALADLAFTVDVLAPTSSVNGPQGAASAGAVVIKFTMGGALEWTITLGGAVSSVNASGGFGDVPFELPEVPLATLPIEPGSVLGSDLAVGDSSSATSTTELAAPPARGAASDTGETAGFLNTSAGFGGLDGAAVVAIGILSIILAAGLRRLSDNVLEAAASACPLEGNSE
jgi:hypothetical protein